MGPMKMVFILLIALAFSSVCSAFPGSPQEKDINDPFVQQFLASTLTQVKAPPKGTDNELITLIKINKVTSQVVSGIKYTYNFEAKGIKTHKLYTCSLSVISRPWAEGDVVQDYHCEQHSSNLLQRSLASENEQGLSSYYGKKPCPGCPLEHDTQDPFVQQFLESTLSTVKAPPKGTDNELITLVKLNRVTSQVVSGIKYTYDFEARGVKTHKLYNCRIVALSRPWAEGETVQGFQCHYPTSNLVQRSFVYSENNQLSGNENLLPGSPQEKDVNDPAVQQFLFSTLTQVKAPPKGTDNELTTLVKVTKVTFQVVSGIKYTYNFEARGIKTNKVYACSLTVMSRPWAEGDVVQDYQCRHLSSKLLERSSVSFVNDQLIGNGNALPGAPREKNVNDPLVHKFLDSTLSLVKAPLKGTDNELTTLVKVNRVIFQVVSGFKYIYDFVARGVKTQKLYNCSLTVVSPPWAQGYIVQDFHC